MFFVGEWVDVDPEQRRGRRDSEGGRAIIKEIEPSYNLQYLVGGQLSQEVDEQRIHHTTLDTHARRRSPNDELRPSLLSHNYEPVERNQQNTAESQTPANNNRQIVTTASMMREALKYNRKRDPEHPVVKRLNSMMERVNTDNGWLRENEAIVTNTPSPSPNTYLSTDEKDLLLKLYFALQNVTEKPVSSRLAYAWGVTKRTVNNIVQKAVASDNLKVERKKRKDTGKMILNCDEKR
jgi:hypothetical protein